MTRAVIYTRPTYHITGEKQNKAILDTFACEWDKYSQPKRYAETRLKMARFEQMLAELNEGDCVYVYNPAIFGIGVERAVENMRKVLAKGARIERVLFGSIDKYRADHIAIAGEIVRECCSIERTREIAHNKGVREVAGGYFDEDTGLWRNGQKKSYEPPHWAFIGQRKADEARFARESSAARKWIDTKIMEAWTTEKIWKEYRALCAVLEENVWERVGKQWINVRRLELTK
jgi:hypothetical protein